MVRKSASKSNQIPPKYLSSFKYEEKPDIQAKLQAVKSGKYSLDKEEHTLNMILRDLHRKSKQAQRKIEKAGLLKF